MLEKLKEIIANFHNIIWEASNEGIIKTMHIDYEKPIVNRIYFPYQDYRIYLHEILPTQNEVYFHPHKWDSAMKILSGSYEMGIGHSDDNSTPPVDCKLILPEGTFYEMTEMNGWHYVKPIGPWPCYTIMIAGKLNGRNMPIESPKNHRKLNQEEISAIITTCGMLSSFRNKLIVESIVGN